MKSKTLFTLTTVALFVGQQGFGQQGFGQQQVVVQSLNSVAQKAKVQEANLSAEHKAVLKRLQRKWIVTSVERDGKPNTAQIGQKKGDIITIGETNAGLMFG